MRVTMSGTAPALTPSGIAERVRGGARIARAIAAMSVGFAIACSGSDHHAATGAPKATVSRPKTAYGKGQSSDAGASDDTSSNAIDRYDDAGSSNEGPIPVGRAKDAGPVPAQPGTEDPAPEDAASGGEIDSGPPPPPLVTLMVDYDGDPPPAEKLPTPKGTCPKFDGVADYTFNVQ